MHHSLLLGYETHESKIVVTAKRVSDNTNFQFTVINCFPMFVLKNADTSKSKVSFTDTGRVHKLRPLMPIDSTQYRDIRTTDGLLAEFREILFGDQASQRKFEFAVGTANCASRKFYRDGFALFSYHTKITHMSLFESDLEQGDVVSFEDFLKRVKLVSDGKLPDFKCCAFDIETSQFNLGKKFEGCASKDAAVTMISVCSFNSRDCANVDNKLFRVGGVLEVNDTEKLHATQEVLCGPNGERVEGETYHYRELLFPSEKDMLAAFFQHVQDEKFDVFLGFNINGFDWPVLFNRWKALSPSPPVKVSQFEQLWDRNAPFKNHFGDDVQVAFRFWESKQKGISVDFFPLNPCFINIDLYKWATSGVLKLGAYSLSEVSKDVLKMNKKDVGYEIVFRAWDHVREPERTDFSLVRDVSDYCVQDSALLVKLFDKVSSIYDVIAQASIYDIHHSTVYTASTTKRLERLYAAHAFDKKFFIPVTRSDEQDSESFTGGFVNDPATGRHICVCIDANSMYPTCIRCFNLCMSSFVTDVESLKRSFPENWDTLVYEVFDDTKPIDGVPGDHGKFDEEIVTVSDDDDCDEVLPEIRRDNAAAFPFEGECQKFYYFKEDVVDAVVPYFVNSLLGKRKDVRKQMAAMIPKGASAQQEKEISDSLESRILDRRQNSFKVAANSIYGLLGSAHGGHKTTASCVTAMSRHLIKLCNKVLVQEHDAFVVYNDTDSVFFKFNKLAGKSEEEQIIETHKLCDNVVIPAINEMCRAQGYKFMNFDKEKVGRGLFFTKKKYVFEVFDENAVYVKTLNTGDAIARRSYTQATKMLYRSLIPMFFEGKNIVDINNFVVWFLLSLCLGDMEQRLILSSASVKDFSEGSRSPLATSVQIANALDANIKECARFFVIPTMIPHPGLSNTEWFDPGKKGHFQTVHRVFDETMLVKFGSCLDNMKTPVGLLFRSFTDGSRNPFDVVVECSKVKIGVTNVELPGSATVLNFMFKHWDSDMIPGKTRHRGFAAVILERCLTRLIEEIKHLIKHLKRDDFMFFFAGRILMAISLVVCDFTESGISVILTKDADKNLASVIRVLSKVAEKFCERRLAFTAKKTPTRFAAAFDVISRNIGSLKTASTISEGSVFQKIVDQCDTNVFDTFDCWKHLCEGKKGESQNRCFACRVSKCQALRR